MVLCFVECVSRASWKHSEVKRSRAIDRKRCQVLKRNVGQQMNKGKIAAPDEQGVELCWPK